MSSHKHRIVSRIPVVSHFYARPRLALGAIVGVVLLFALPDSCTLTTRLLTAWDCGVGVYLALACWLMSGAKSDDIRHQADRQDAGRVAVLVMSVVASVATLAAIVAELGEAKQLSGLAQGQHVALAGLTVVLSWCFMHTMFAIHYAHEYYMGPDGNPCTPGDEGGLDFPHEDKPDFTADYWDFMYFSFVIGAAAQTADIDITGRALRRLAGLHCVLAFFFNTTILALTINIGAGLIS